MMRQDEDRMVVWRIFAPPTPPRLVQPRSANRAEHVAAHDRGADARVAARNELLVDVVRAAAPHAMHLAPRAAGEGPLVESFPTLAQRILQALIRPGRVAVQRDREVVY